MREFQDINVSEECAEAFVKILEILCQKKSLNEDGVNYDLSLRINYSPMAFNKRILTMLDIAPPSISVVLPYFNHKDYILERLTSIIDQQIPINEIIALDNNSSDSGFDLVTNFLEKQDIFNFTVLRNSINNGNVFKQWHKGVSTSTSDYVWITETDDSAHPSFLADLLPMLQDPSVVIATSNSKLIDSKGELIGLGNNIYEGISNPQRFSSSYVNDGHREIYEAIGICNTIPNVSACIFRRKDLLQALDTLGDYLYTFKYAGDWLVYIQLLTQGSIAYNANSLNLFRQHQDSNIRLANKRKLLEEIEEVQNYAKNKIKSDNSFIMSQNLYLEDVRRHLDLS
jgi:glycosyltransferase involved in cell wall biosynthesis